MAEILDVTDATFEAEILKSDTPALIDFWAEWCTPCRQIAPLVKDLAARYGGRVKVVKMNIDENQATPARYGIRSIPTVLAFKGGAVVGQVTGVSSKVKTALDELAQKVL
jgi:thioredoxin 1